LQPTADQQDKLQELAATFDEDGQQRLIAATCYLTRCAAGVPSGDPLHDTITSLQDAGSAFTYEIGLLQASGEFSGYGLLARASDFAARNVQITDGVQDATLAVAGAAGVVGGYVLASGGAAACATGVGCVAGAPAIAGGVVIAGLSLQQAQQSTNDLFNTITNYEHTTGVRILSSLSLEGDHPGQDTPLTNLALTSGLLVLEAVIGRYGPPILDDLLDRSPIPTISPATVPTTTPATRQVTDTGDDVGGQSSEADNIATAPKLADQLRQQNLDNIAQADSRLAQAVAGSGSSNPNFGIGSASASEANRLGLIWVGDGHRVASDGRTLISADGTLRYRPPTSKKTPVEFNPTGTQANFEIYSIDGNTILSNGHLVIE